MASLMACRKMNFRPCIDVHKGKVKQIVGSTLSDDAKSVKTNFVSGDTPAHFADLYKSSGLRGGHMILLSRDEETDRVARQALREYPQGLQIGGGVNPRNAESYLEEGASHVIVTSYIFKHGKLEQEKLKLLADVVGRERLVLDLSCRRKGDDYYVVTDRWQRFSSLKVTEETLSFLAQYADEFLIHGVDVEGKRLGIDMDLVKLLGDYSPIPSTYAGGVCNIEDMETIKRVGRGMVDATIGSALNIFGGDLSYERVVQWHNEQEDNGRG